MGIPKQVHVTVSPNSCVRKNIVLFACLWVCSQLPILWYCNFNCPLKKQLTTCQGVNSCSVSNFALAICPPIHCHQSNRSWPARGPALSLSLKIPTVSWRSVLVHNWYMGLLSRICADAIRNVRSYIKVPTSLFCPPHSFPFEESKYMPHFLSNELNFLMPSICVGLRFHPLASKTYTN